MRIRTIKPEFWTHPVLARLDDSARLAAVGVLNVADDEGYFYADPALIRAHLWAFAEDSATARRVLAELSRIDFIQVRQTETHGAIGVVVNFTKHQRVDKPRASKIKDIFDSVTIPGTVAERSTEEGNGTGNGMEGNGGVAGKAGDFALAPPINGKPKPLKITSPITLKGFFERCTEAHQEPIPEDDAVFQYATKAGIPHEFLHLGWKVFRAKYVNNAKRYTDWRQAFRNWVEAGGYGLWTVDVASNQYRLTGKGLQAQKAHK